MRMRMQRCGMVTSFLCFIYRADHSASLLIPSSTNKQLCNANEALN
jgi:hypothetical protein